MKNGLPYYADGSGYKGDLSVSMEKEGRDERLQLFVFGEEDIVRSDPADPAVAKNNEVVILDTIPLVTSSVELQDLQDTVLVNTTTMITTSTRVIPSSVRQEP